METTAERQLNTGLLIMRLGLAATLMFYALPRLMDGAGAWTAVGKDMRFLDADFSAQVVGLIILLIEVLAGLGMLTGYLFRLSSVLLAAAYSLYFLITSMSAIKHCLCMQGRWHALALGFSSPVLEGLRYP